MANFIKYHTKVFRKAWKDSAAPFNAVLRAQGWPEVGMMKFIALLTFIYFIVHYALMGKFSWNSEQLENSALSSCVVLIAISFFFCINLLMAPSRIDAKQEETISSLTEKNRAKEEAKAAYAKLVKYRKIIVDEYVNHLLPYDPEEETYRKIYFKLDILIAEIAEHVTTNFSPYYGAIVATLGELSPKFRDPIKNIAAEVNVRLDEILKLYDPSPPIPKTLLHPSAPVPCCVAE